MKLDSGNMERNSGAMARALHWGRPVGRGILGEVAHVVRVVRLRRRESSMQDLTSTSPSVGASTGSL